MVPEVDELLYRLGGTQSQVRLGQWRTCLRPYQDILKSVIPSSFALLQQSLKLVQHTFLLRPICVVYNGKIVAKDLRFYSSSKIQKYLPSV